MIRISFVTGELIFTAVWLLIRIAVWIRNGGADWKREALLLLMYVNLAVIIRFSFFPMELADGRIRPLILDTQNIFPFEINTVPFVHMRDYVSDRAELVNFFGNIAMYIPGGVMLPIVYPRLDGFWKVTAAGASICLCVEILQLPFPSRVSDVDDLIVNYSLLRLKP
ncbi:MAG: VanZ family protein [Eubacteriaceae bacterium]|nr:VanZ family protein [Eubacteriaceae bacterium]